LTIPTDAKVIDLGDATLLPGLIDVHTHLLSEMDGTNLTLQDVEMLRIVATQSTAERALLGAKLGREDLEAGITTVRDVGNSGVSGDVALRTAFDQGWLLGPRMVVSTRALAPQGGQFGRMTPEAQKLIEEEYVTIRGAESARQAVRQALYDGAGCIKVIVNGPPGNVTIEEMKALLGRAKSASWTLAFMQITNVTACAQGIEVVGNRMGALFQNRTRRTVVIGKLNFHITKPISNTDTEATVHPTLSKIFIDPQEDLRPMLPDSWRYYLTGSNSETTLAAWVALSRKVYGPGLPAQ
jgi:predicted amidohydrolase YtcJ